MTARSRCSPYRSVDGLAILRLYPYKLPTVLTLFVVVLVKVTIIEWLPDCVVRVSIRRVASGSGRAESTVPSARQYCRESAYFC